MLGFVVGFLVVAGTSVNDTPADAPAMRYHFRERRPLVLDGTRVAVYKREGVPPWASLDLPPAGVERRASAGWYTVRLGPVARSWQDMQQLVHTLARLDNVALLDFAAPVFSVENEGWFFPTSRLLVGVSTPDTGARLPLKPGEDWDSEWADEPRLLRVQTVERDGFAMFERARGLLWDSDVREDIVLAEPDMVFSIQDPLEPHSLTPSDPNWGLNALRLPDACKVTGCGNGVRVVVLDDGIQHDHPGLPSKFLGKDFTNKPAASGGEPASYCDRHGTTVAGALAGIDKQAPGAAPGVELASARIAANEVLGEDHCGGRESHSSWTVAALAWARTIRARITVNSGTYSYDSAAVAWQYVLTHMPRADFLGLVHFAAAGNEHQPAIGAPARFSAVNGVAGTSRRRCHSTYTNFGCEVAVAAPGADIPVTDLVGDRGYALGDYTTGSGTSYATPYAAGVAAVLLGIDSTLTPCKVEAHLRASAHSLNSCIPPDTLGAGLLDACAAIERLGKHCAHSKKRR